MEVLFKILKTLFEGYKSSNNLLHILTITSFTFFLSTSNSLLLIYGRLFVYFLVSLFLAVLFLSCPCITRLNPLYM